VAWALQRWPQLRLSPPTMHLGSPGLSSGSTTSTSSRVPGCDAGLTAAQAACVQRFDPGGGDDDTMGFFISRFIKTATTLVP